ncbi:MAG: hypothetical protein ACK4SY_10490, partial [Pyrobaculum sp.]
RVKVNTDVFTLIALDSILSYAEVDERYVYTLAERMAKSDPKTLAEYLVRMVVEPEDYKYKAKLAREFIQRAEGREI